VTAVKRAEDRDELVVRLLNQSGEPRRARVRPYRAAAIARRLNLAEEPMADLPISEGSIEVAAGPWEIVTVGIGFEG
jgi:alpha-mannosidase